jgi:hypothetical protein
MEESATYYHLFVVVNVYVLKAFNEIVDEPYMVRSNPLISGD